jgi:hypothetical protein
MIRMLRVGAGAPVQWGTPGTCRACGASYGGVEIEIIEGRIETARRLPLADIHRAESNWTLDRRAGWVERTDWHVGHVFEVADCETSLLATQVSDVEVDRRPGLVEQRMIAEDGYDAVPRYALLDAELDCPHCKTPLRLLPAFWWGYVSDVPSLRSDLSNRTPTTYHLGDGIRWRTVNGVVHAWTRFTDGLGLNAGDPETRRAVVMGGSPLSQGVSDYCLSCHRQLGGVAIGIEDGIIASARYFPIGEFDPFSFDHLTYAPDGTLVPHSDLLHHPLAEAEGD